MISVGFINVRSINDINYVYLLSLVPNKLRQKIDRYTNKIDKIRSLIGKILLRKMLMQEGYKQDVLNSIELDSYNRPYINDTIDFNISHSGDYVVCAVSKRNRVGVDIEQILNIDYEHYDLVLTSKEKDEIAVSHNSLESFYKIWTKKEASLKANGKGFSIENLDLKINDSFSVIGDSEIWNLEKLHINKNYVSYLASERPGKIIQSEYFVTDLIK